MEIIQKRVKDRSRNSSKEGKQMAVRHVEAGSVSRETQGKATAVTSRALEQQLRKVALLKTWRKGNSPVLTVGI